LKIMFSRILLFWCWQWGRSLYGFEFWFGDGFF